LRRNAASALASPEKMNLKKVLGDRNSVLLPNCSVRFPACRLLYVKVLLLALTLYKQEEEKYERFIS
jgi:hypothetical protein